MKPWVWVVGAWLLLSKRSSGAVVNGTTGQVAAASTNPLSQALAALQQSLKNNTSALSSAAKPSTGVGSGGGGSTAGAGIPPAQPKAPTSSNTGSAGAASGNQLLQFLTGNTPSSGDIASDPGPGDFQISPVEWDGNGIVDQSGNVYVSDTLDSVPVDQYDISPVQWDGTGIVDNSGSGGDQIATIDTPSSGDISSVDLSEPTDTNYDNYDGTYFDPSYDWSE